MSERKPDVIFHVYSDHTVYRVRPNPDGEPGSGYEYGAALDWSDSEAPGEKWEGYFFIAPEAIAGLVEALTEAAKRGRP